MKHVIHSCPCFLLAGLLGLSHFAYAAAPEETWVALVETDDSLCLAHGGRLVSLTLTDAAMPAQNGAVEVWVDRWFMQVQTADHTRHLLTASVPEQALGCSQSMAGPQHWTLSTIRRLPEGNTPARKELP